MSDVFTGLVGRWLSNGSILDRIGGNDGVLTPGTGGFRKTERGLALFLDGAVTILTIGNTGKTIKSATFWIKASDITTRDIIDFDGGTHSIELDGSGDITATGFDTPTITTDNVANASVDKDIWTFVTVTSATGFDADNMIIGKETSFTSGYLQDVRTYESELSAAEKTRIYNATVKGLHRTQTKRNFFYPGPASIREAGLVGAWNMESVDDEIIDVSGNGNDGTINGAQDIKGVTGRALRLKSANQNSVDIQGISITAYPFALEVIAISEVASTQTFMTLADFSAGSRYFTINRDADSIVILRRNTTARSTDTAVTIDINKIYHMVVNFINETTIELILNGIQEYYSDALDSVDAPNANFDVIGLGVRRFNSPTDYFDGIIENTPRVYSKVITVAEALARYRKIADQVLFRDDNSDVGADGITQSAGLGEYRIDSGTFNYTEDATGKFIECDTNGTISIPYDPALAVGNGYLKQVVGDLSGDQDGTIDASSAFSVANNRLSIAMTAGQKLREFAVIRAA